MMTSTFRHLYFILLLAIPAHVFAKVPDTTCKEGYFNLRMGKYFDGQKNPVKALSYYTKATSLFDQHKNFSGSGRGHLLIGRLYRDQNQPSYAIYHINRGMEKYAKGNDIAGMIQCLNQLAVYYGDLGLAEKALSCYSQEIYLCERSNDSLMLGIALSNVAGIYSKFVHKDKGLEYNLKALDVLRKTSQKKAQGYVLNNIGSYYMDKGDYDKALLYYNQSLNVKREIGDLQGVVFTLDNMGEIYLKRRQISEAGNVCLEAMKIALSTGDQLSQCCAFNTLGKYFQADRDDQRAVEMLTTSLDLSRRIGFRELEIENLMDLTRSMENLKDYRQAISYHRKYIQLNDSIEQENNRKTIAEINAKYETTIREKTILKLSAEKMLNVTRIQKNRLLILSLSVGIFVILVFSFLIVYYYREKVEAYKNLVRQDVERIRTELAIPEKPNTEAPGNELSEYDPSPTNGKPKSLPAEDLQEKLAEDLILMMTAGRRFLDPDVTLSDLAKELNSNTSYLSRIINERFSVNVNLFINSYRIKEAKKMLLDASYSNLSIEGIARSVGFNSKSVFNATFKKITGVTPSFYQRSALRMLDEERSVMKETEKPA